MLQSSGNVNRDEVLPELNSVQSFSKMVKQDALALFNSLRSAYSATLKVIDLYVGVAVSTAIIQVVYMALVGSFPFNSFLSGVLSCIGTAVLAVCLRIQVNKENKEFEDLAPDGPLQILFSAIWCCIW